MKRKALFISIMMALGAVLGVSGDSYAAEAWDSCADTDVVYVDGACYSDINAALATHPTSRLTIFRDGEYVLNQDYEYSHDLNIYSSDSSIIIDGADHTVRTSHMIIIASSNPANSITVRNLNIIETGTNQESLLIGSGTEHGFKDVIVQNVNIDCADTCSEGNGVTNLGVVGENILIDNYTSTGHYLACGLMIGPIKGGETVVQNSNIGGHISLIAYNFTGVSATITIKKSQVGAIWSVGGSATTKVVLEDVVLEKGKDILLVDSSLDGDISYDTLVDNYLEELTVFVDSGEIPYIIKRTMQQGETIDLSELFPFDVRIIDSSRGDGSTVSIADDSQWQITDDSIVSLSGSSLKATALGNTTVSAVFQHGNTKLAVTIMITVEDNASPDTEANPNTLDIAPIIAIIAGITCLGAATGVANLAKRR